VNRRTKLIERAGALDRTERHLKEAQRNTSNAYRELGNIDPELAEAIAAIMVRFDSTLRRLANE